MVLRTSADLLSEIQVDALDPAADLAGVLRMCIVLGGEVSSARLRDWATSELKGYEPGNELPSYRLVRPMLFMDGATVGSLFTGQQVPLSIVPDVAQARTQEDIHLNQSIAEIVELAEAARRAGDDAIRLAPLGAEYLVALINDKLAKADDPMRRTVGLPPSQMVERVYWMIHRSVFVAIIDTVRTTLVELVTEMKAGVPAEGSLPSKEVAEQAVDVAIGGSRNRVVVQVVGAGSTAAAAGSGASTGDAEPESGPRRWMWWGVGAATIVGAAATVLTLFYLW